MRWKINVGVLISTLITIRASCCSDFAMAMGFGVWSNREIIRQGASKPSPNQKLHYTHTRALAQGEKAGSSETTQFPSSRFSGNEEQITWRELAEGRQGINQINMPKNARTPLLRFQLVWLHYCSSFITSILVEQLFESFNLFAFYSASFRFRKRLVVPFFFLTGMQRALRIKLGRC